ncbi:MAG: FAD/NAD(P)-binding protein [Acidobacteria bacterium]|nr:FAD/NAD(P)-binding protein [Acidobacteriota bacterium]
MACVTDEVLVMNGAEQSPMLPDLYKVRQVHRETDDAFTLELGRAAGHQPFGFSAGQFNMLYVHGIGEVPISISGDPGGQATLVHTTRAVGAVTRAMRALRAGDMLGVRGPFGVGWPVAQAEGHDVVVVAGGIGLAPLRPTIYHVLANRDRYGRVVILYGTRTPGDILFRKQLEAWRARLDIEVYVTVDRATEGWNGNVGVVTKLVPKAPFDRTRTVAMICGPEIMMRFTALELERRGIDADHIYLSMERNMKCGIGLCGHCQCGAAFICKDGPVFRYDAIRELLSRREI